MISYFWANDSHGHRHPRTLNIWFVSLTIGISYACNQSCQCHPGVSSEIIRFFLCLTPSFSLSVRRCTYVIIYVRMSYILWRICVRVCSLNKDLTRTRRTQIAANSCSCVRMTRVHELDTYKHVYTLCIYGWIQTMFYNIMSYGKSSIFGSGHLAVKDDLSTGRRKKLVTYFYIGTL